MFRFAGSGKDFFAGFPKVFNEGDYASVDVSVLHSLFRKIVSIDFYGVIQF